MLLNVCFISLIFLTSLFHFFFFFTPSLSSLYHYTPFNISTSSLIISVSGLSSVHSLVLLLAKFSFFFINYEISYTIDIIPIHQVGKVYSTCVDANIVAVYLNSLTPIINFLTPLVFLLFDIKLQPHGVTYYIDTLFLLYTLYIPRFLSFRRCSLYIILHFTRTPFNYLSNKFSLSISLSYSLK